MTLFQCVADRRFDIIWQIGFGCLIAFFFILCLYALLPLIRYWKEFRSLPKINQQVRVSFIIALFCKMFGFIFGEATTYILRDEEMPYKEHMLRISGLICLETPAFLTTTCYTLVLIFCLSLCSTVLPFRYVRLFSGTRICLYIYNVVIYALLIAEIIIEIVCKEPNLLTNVFSGVVGITRDLFLCSIFVLFIILLKNGLGEDSYAESSINETHLFTYTIMLSILLLIRGIITLVQATSLYGNDRIECGIPFFIIIMITEIFVEGLPLVYILYMNNDFLGKQRRNSFNMASVLYTDG